MSWMEDLCVVVIGSGCGLCKAVDSRLQIFVDIVDCVGRFCSVCLSLSRAFWKRSVGCVLGDLRHREWFVWGVVMVVD